MTTTQRIHARLIKRDLEAESALPEATRSALPGNSLRLIGANALQSSGDQAVNASTVLPWLFHALGVPAVLTGALVPIRESGSMLPQAFLTPSWSGSGDAPMSSSPARSSRPPPWPSWPGPRH